eukprot:9472011-Pyramimonas_sp.AAC.1
MASAALALACCQGFQIEIQREVPGKKRGQGTSDKKSHGPMGSGLEFLRGFRISKREKRECSNSKLLPFEPRATWARTNRTAGRGSVS